VADSIFKAIADSHQFSANVVVLTFDDLKRIIGSNPFPHETLDHSRHLVAFTAAPDDLKPAEPLTEQNWDGEEIEIRGIAAFLWMPRGVADSELRKGFEKATRDAATARNWATVLKIRAAAEAISDKTK
jgi:uncharacterized protein (DUF1697 family)